MGSPHQRGPSPRAHDTTAGSHNSRAPSTKPAPATHHGLGATLRRQQRCNGVCHMRVPTIVLAAARAPDSCGRTHDECAEKGGHDPKGRHPAPSYVGAQLHHHAAEKGLGPDHRELELRSATALWRPVCPHTHRTCCPARRARCKHSLGVGKAGRQRRGAQCWARRTCHTQCNPTATQHSCANGSLIDVVRASPPWHDHRGCVCERYRRGGQAGQHTGPDRAGLAQGRCRASNGDSPATRCSPRCAERVRWRQTTATHVFGIEDEGNLTAPMAPRAHTHTGPCATLARARAHTHTHRRAQHGRQPQRSTHMGAAPASPQIHRAGASMRRTADTSGGCEALA